MAQEKVLIIEDNHDLAQIMADFLKNDGFQVRTIFEGQTALAVFQEFLPELVILDIMLPGLDGIEVCRQIRGESHVPIMIISAKNSDLDKVLSLGVGADDYLTKPFSMMELVARVKSHLRRFISFQSQTKVATLVFGQLIIDPVAFQVTVNQREIPLTSKEFNLLVLLASHENQVFSKEQIMTQVWGHETYLDGNTVAVYIGRLRDKLLKEQVDYIKTVWGVGYKWSN